MKLKYTEGPAAVTVEGIGRVERGEAKEITDADLATKLQDQGWEVVGGGSPAAASSTSSSTTAASTTTTTPADPAKSGAASTTPEPGPKAKE